MKCNETALGPYIYFDGSVTGTWFSSVTTPYGTFTRADTGTTGTFFDNAGTSFSLSAGQLWNSATSGSYAITIQ